MAKVFFRCDREHRKMFILNSLKELEYIPMVGDKISTSNEDFMKASYRVKPYSKKKDKISKVLKDCISLNFTVKSREYSLMHDKWILICEPTPESLMFLLSEI